MSQQGPDMSKGKPASGASAAVATGSGALAESDFAADARKPVGIGDAVRDYLDRIKHGDVGGLPAVLGLLALCILFSILRPHTFPSSGNFANLITQASAIIVLAMGLVFVLLLGEIDLGAGVSGAMSAAFMAKALLDGGQSWWVAVLIGLLSGIVTGLFVGILVSYVGIPSFVVTLAVFLAAQGVILWLVGDGGVFALNDKTIKGLTSNNLPIGVGWGLAAVLVGLLALSELNKLRVRRSRHLLGAGLSIVLLRVGVFAALIVGFTAVLSKNRALIPTVTIKGVPVVVLLIIALYAAASFVLARTPYGRHLYAIGGNAEAARRAGINVARLRVSVFVIGSTFAAISGIIYASRLSSVSGASGGGNTLLYAVGAAVIGGTSLFGGKGKASNAIIGGLVIAVIDNGLSLMAYEAYVNYLVTGGVLLLAASVDALSRRRREASGR